ncbi:MAG: MoaD/ThiS family protein [Desulfobacterales bacterium]|nr:MAG: MoaD/ThiS family protein [Desulfobacterales bacterium]
MKIYVESLGLPTLSKLIGKKTEIELPGETIEDLVSFIVTNHGQKARQILLDSKGKLDLTIQVMLNDEGFVPRDEFSQRSLKDGDLVKFLLLAGGG